MGGLLWFMNQLTNQSMNSQVNGLVFLGKSKPETMVFTIQLMGFSGFNFPIIQFYEHDIPINWLVLWCFYASLARSWHPSPTKTAIWILMDPYSPQSNISFWVIPIWNETSTMAQQTTLETMVTTWRLKIHPFTITETLISINTWWLIPLSKWVITPIISGISRVNPLKSLGL